jgi:predicted PurR-regulated permease PerM
MNAVSSTDNLRPLIVLGTLIALVFILSVASKILIPIALGILISFALNPAVQYLTKRGIRRVYAVSVVVAITTLVVGLLLLGLFTQLRDLTDTLPTYRENFREKVQALLGPRDQTQNQGPLAQLSEMLAELSREVQDPEDKQNELFAQPVRIVGERWSGFNFLPTLAGPVASLLGAISLTIGLTVSMLLMRDDLRNRLLLVMGDGQLTSATKAMDDVSQRISRYLIIQVALNSLFGAIFGIALAVVGVPYPLVWAVLAFCLRFVPYIGTWLAAIFPLLLSIGATGWGQAYAVLGIVLVLTIAFNNFMEPMLVSRTVGVTPIALVVSMAFWTWLWGPIGLVLATPMTVGLSVVGKYFPALRYFDILLGQATPISPDLRLYQRLLARDDFESVDLLENFLKKPDHTQEQLLEEVILPTLGRIRYDAERGQLSPADVDELARRLEQLLMVVLGDPEPTMQASQCLVACPGADRLDDLAIEWLERVLPPRLARVERVSTEATAAEVLKRIHECKPVVVLLSVVPPTGSVRARYLAKRIQADLPELPIIAGVWGAIQANDPLLVQFTSSGVRQVGTSLNEVRSLIVPILQVQPHLVEAPVAAIVPDA